MSGFVIPHYEVQVSISQTQQQARRYEAALHYTVLRAACFYRPTLVSPAPDWRANPPYGIFISE
jgi:hypothetical protein